jgi:heme/copper-type cytochrome/quinol oxidase subunit 2
MTSGHVGTVRRRGGRARGGWLGRLGALALLLPLSAAGEHHEEAAGHAAPEAASPIQVLSANVQGKNVYIPATIVVEEGRPQVLSIFNATDTPHGFAIPDLGIEVVLPVGEEFELKLPPLEGGRIHRIHCQLHAPHRNATLVVLDD